MDVRRVAVLGAGNGGCAAAADLSDRGYEVSLWTRSRDRLGPIRERGGIQLEGVRSAFGRVSVAADEIHGAIADADVVMLAVPISAYPFYAGALADLLDEQVVFLNPGHMGGGLYFAHEVHRRTGRTDIRTCEVSTLTYACRMRDTTTVEVFNVVSDLAFAAFPGRHAAELLETVRPLYPDIAPAGHVLETGFQDINAIEHPPQIICNAGWIEHTKGDYLFYFEGTTPAVGRVIDVLDRERIAIAEAAGVRTRSFVETFFTMGYTTEAAMNTGSAYAALQASAPNRWIKGPPSLDHRYVHEDVGWGLVPWSEMAGILDVRTPTMDALITLGSEMNGIDYRREGLTLERLGLAGRNLRDLEPFLRQGIGG